MAETLLEGTLEETGNTARNRLFRYISRRAVDPQWARHNAPELRKLMQP